MTHSFEQDSAYLATLLNARSFLPPILACLVRSAEPAKFSLKLHGCSISS